MRYSSLKKNVRSSENACERFTEEVSIEDIRSTIVGGYNVRASVVEGTNIGEVLVKEGIAVKKTRRGGIAYYTASPSLRRATKFRRNPMVA